MTTQKSFDAAQKFLKDSLLAPTLAQSYGEIVQKAYVKNDPSMITTWLSQQGYDTTPTTLLQAQEQMQENVLSYWVGVYGKTAVKESTGYIDGPPLVVKDNDTVLLNNVPLKKFSFSNKKLRWDLSNNSTAGCVDFVEIPVINQNPDPPQGYTGKEFSGTIQMSSSENSKTYTGQIGPITAFPLEYWSGYYGTTSIKQSDGTYKK